jgi:hypothetical protein
MKTKQRKLNMPLGFPNLATPNAMYTELKMTFQVGKLKFMITIKEDFEQC